MLALINFGTFMQIMYNNNNIMKTKLFTFLFAITIITSVSLADPVQIGNLSYTLDSEAMTAIVQAGSGHTTSGHITIPSTITYNGKDYQVTSIKINGFLGNSDIQSVTIPGSITKIARGAFEGCSKLNSVILSNGIRIIDESAFNRCGSLNTITLPSSITSTRIGAFANCTGLTSVICEAVSPPLTGSNLFMNVNCSRIPLYVPAESVDAYKAAEKWKEFNPILPIQDSPTDIENTTDANNNATKVLRDGQIYILRGEKIYTTTGMEMK